MPTPPLGLLLDVDGPIASPVTRSIAIPSIARDLAELANRGIPIAFNTGRSDAFLRDQVIPLLVAEGLGDDARLWGICEKGAVWMRITAAGAGEVTVDENLRMPEAFARDMEQLVRTDFADLVFFDDTKRAMISVEQLTDIPNREFRDRQPQLNEAIAALMRRHGLGYEWEGRRAADAEGRIRYRIDPTIISTDIESNRLGKDRGASLMLSFLAEEGIPLPRRWRTLGDSRTDYAMSDWLYDNGHDVVHVDVRPGDGVPSTPYPVRHHSSLIHDEAGALYLNRWVAMVRGEADDDADLG
ncbi:hypothetical protein JRG78_07280 [Microbacterium sp. EF45047]|nr:MULTISPECIES: hypothetical protein [Microbacterium]UWF78683.1 hypothetical protein JSY13_07280 [Microbacterium neungamense]WCM56851.1 hypothetical protein JRG78_07280 [Microbacterium sp. EF45047]